MSYAGSEWLKRNCKNMNPSPLGCAVADLLGAVFRGLYHLSPTSIDKATWENDWCVDIVIGRELATVDGCELTLLVLLAHDAAIRVSVEGVGPGYMRLRFHQRKREGALHERHPTIEDHVKLLRDHFGDGGGER